MASTAELVNEWGAYVPDMVDAISSGLLDGHLPELLAAIQAQMITNGTVATRRRPGSAPAQPEVNPGFSAGTAKTATAGFNRDTLPQNPPMQAGRGKYGLMGRHFVFPYMDTKKRGGQFSQCIAQVVKINKTRCVVKVVGHMDPYVIGEYMHERITVYIPNAERMIQEYDATNGVLDA